MLLLVPSNCNLLFTFLVIDCLSGFLSRFFRLVLDNYEFYVFSLSVCYVLVVPTLLLFVVKLFSVDMLF